ncbi:hypothetical protein DFA_01293 [Cavenderia fasciculata]|uniref:Transmembrane protein n=1 Tax=Cavenderia fasciculata TaxID=261658 RepID=F4PRX3_CACFS|nr:uncharacterized protein DFA_01293 [Cavenderia fasciculata]EGG21409.1 hypothetical protein DFA_01293 [Cavenderia fasciculata]|eukprot:XP_004359259.1 hypothetical protein DFA_01293 [Cavenderia fasciculata]
MTNNKQEEEGRTKILVDSEELKALTQERDVEHQRVHYLLFHKFESITDTLIKGAAVGAGVGVAVGLLTPLAIRNTDRVTSLLKSVVNFSFIGVVYQGTSYALDRSIAVQPVANSFISGGVSCAAASMILTGGAASGLRGGFIGSLMFGAATLTKRFINHDNTRTLRDDKDKLGEIKYILSRHVINLSPEEKTLLHQLSSTVHKHHHKSTASPTNNNNKKEEEEDSK